MNKGICVDIGIGGGSTKLSVRNEKDYCECGNPIFTYKKDYWECDSCANQKSCDEMGVG